MVEYHPLSGNDPTRLQQFGKIKKAFQASALYAGGICKGDILIADVEEQQNVDASEIHAVRLSAKEVLASKRGDEFIFPYTDGTVKLAGKSHEVGTSIQTRNRPDQGEEHQDELQGEADRPDPAEQL